MNFPSLFSPLQVGPYRLQHRVVMAPLTRMRAERSSFAPRALNAEYYGQRANATTFGLGSGVWTRDVGKAHRVAKALRAGSVWVNCYQATDPAVPFGGYKMSGYGRESGKQHLEEYLNVKAVWIKTA